MKARTGVIEHYRDFLPVSATTPIVSLGEGDTPLVPAPRLAEATDPSLSIWLKCEGFNPTGSFKDRGMTMAVSKAPEAGSRAVICASTGNTSASAAAFAARAGIRAFVMVPKGAVALGKLAREEGIFMEPASAATVAGLVKSVKAGRFEPGSTLVLTLTGHGLKDPDTALESASRPATVPAVIDAVLAQLGL